MPALFVLYAVFAVAGGYARAWLPGCRSDDLVQPLRWLGYLHDDWNCSHQLQQVRLLTTPTHPPPPHPSPMPSVLYVEL